MTLRELVEASAKRLADAGVAFGHGTTNAFDEAAWLVLHALALPLDTDISPETPDAQRMVEGAALARAESLVARRIETRQPAAYLTQQAWLQGVPFYVDARAIVPRSLIAEVLAEGVIDAWLPPATRRVLDLCTGNGSLAVLAALAWPDVEVDASDVSAAALEVAHRNVQEHGLQRRIAVLESDGLRAVRGPYDLILCNPPYVNAHSMDALPAEYRAEPRLALAGGEDGMDFIRGLLRDAAAHLNPHGVLVLEIGNERAHFDAAFPALEPVWLATSAGDDQVLLLARDML